MPHTRENIHRFFLVVSLFDAILCELPICYIPFAYLCGRFNYINKFNSDRIKNGQHFFKINLFHLPPCPAPESIIGVPPGHDPNEEMKCLISFLPNFLGSWKLEALVIGYPLEEP